MRGEERSLVAAIISRSATIRAPLKWSPPHHSNYGTAVTELDSENVHCSMAWKRGRANHSVRRHPSTVHYYDLFGCGVGNAACILRIASSWTKGILGTAL